MNEANGGLWCFCWKAVSLSSRVAYGTLGASTLALVVHGLPYGAPLSKYQVGEFGRRPACTSGPREARRRFVNEVGAVHDEVPHAAENTALRPSSSTAATSWAATHSRCFEKVVRASLSDMGSTLLVETRSKVHLPFSVAGPLLSTGKAAENTVALLVSRRKSRRR